MLPIDSVNVAAGLSLGEYTALSFAGEPGGGGERNMKKLKKWFKGFRWPFLVSKAFVRRVQAWQEFKGDKRLSMFPKVVDEHAAKRRLNSALVRDGHPHIHTHKS